MKPLVSRRTATGISMVSWTNPTVAQQLLFNTVRIETVDERGKPVGTGTSFVLNHRFPNGHEELFLVTNKHVVSGGFTGHIYFTMRKDDGSPHFGEPFFVRIDHFEKTWHGHPDRAVDVCVMPLSKQLEAIEKDGATPYLMRISSRVLADEDYVGSADAFMPILFVGYPNGLFDEVNFTPIVRQGTLATPLQLDFSGRPVFLIDASVFPGSSGSPVFAYDLSIKGHIIDVKLLGVIAEVFTQDASGRIELAPAPTAVEPIVRFEQIIDLGVVFKSHLIREALDSFGHKHGFGYPA